MIPPVIYVTAKDSVCTAETDGLLVCGTEGLQVVVSLDESFDGLTERYLCTECGNIRERFPIDDSMTVKIPASYFVHGSTLKVGVDAWSQDWKKRIPTTWATCGYVHSGAACI